MQAALLLAPPSVCSEEGARGGFCQQPICTACLPTRLLSQAPTFLSEAAGEPFSRRWEVFYGWTGLCLGADMRQSPGAEGPLSASFQCSP